MHTNRETKQINFVGKPTWMATDPNQLEQELQGFGQEIFEEVQSASLSVFDPEFYTGKLINWAMQDEEFKISLFRFVDVLPSLNDSASVISHVQEYFQPVAHKIPGVLKWGLNVDPNSVSSKVAAQVVRKNVRSMAERFIVGEDPQSALKALRKIRKDGLAFTVDLLGEATVGEDESQEYLDRYLELLRTLKQEIFAWPESQPLVEGHPGESTPLNISVKLSALYSQSTPINADRAVSTLSERLSQILTMAREVDGFVYIDMEDSGLTDITLRVAEEVFCDSKFRDYEKCGLVLQAYMRRTGEDLDQIFEWLRRRGTPIAIRLVKGAYWDTETLLAKQKHWPIPVWQQKAASDLEYERLSLKLLEHRGLVLPAFGSHNIRSLCHAIKAAELGGLSNTDFELQALYGMAEPIKKAFINRGYLVRDYAPIGELIPGMGYLVRRLLENTSNEGFLRQGFHDGESAEQLLRKPQLNGEDTGTDHIETNYREKFINVPLADFSIKSVRDRQAQAIEEVTSRLRAQAVDIKPVLAGVERDTSNSMPTISPENTDFKLGTIHLASIEQADECVTNLQQAFPAWRDTSVEDRANIMFRAAELLEEQRYELNATISLEAGKPWIEADADVAEAIDFLYYYAHQALNMAVPQKMGNFAGEENYYFYEPRGVALVISPWNFPIAIPCGMYAAALVTGNCTILKPAEQTSLIAKRLFEIMLEAGLPPECTAFLPGLGEEVGAHLVDHPGISTIVFTGSKDVGLQIVERAARVSEGQEHVKRVIAEMGGKNAIIVDDGADLDEAVKGIVYSAFGFQGQKCSACSRAFVVESVYDRFLERLGNATESIIVGPPTESGSYVGPVIDDEAQQRLLGAIEDGKNDCTLFAQGSPPPANAPHGYYVQPTIFTDVPADHHLLTRELFGPVLAVVKVKDFEAALEMALDSEFGLTGALFSRSPKNIAAAAERFRVGNLYLNRGSTGALVMRQPFGGAKMSGIGSKAGGPDYLRQFVIPRTVTENTMRRGFAPMTA